jgi:hypothetical protein
MQEARALTFWKIIVRIKAGPLTVREKLDPAFN